MSRQRRFKFSSKILPSIITSVLIDSGGGTIFISVGFKGRLVAFGKIVNLPLYSKIVVLMSLRLKYHSWRHITINSLKSNFDFLRFLRYILPLFIIIVGVPFINLRIRGNLLVVSAKIMVMIP